MPRLLSRPNSASGKLAPGNTMKHKIEVSDPTRIAGSREWTCAFGRIRDAFIAKLKECIETNAINDCRVCDTSGKEQECHFDDVCVYLSHMIDDGIKVAYAVCDQDGHKVLWVCASDELRKKPAWPCRPANVVFHDAHFGVVAVKRSKRTLPVDEKYIAEAEEQLGVQFPQSYKSRMAQANGGQLKVGKRPFVLYPIFDKTDRKSIRRTAESIVTEGPKTSTLSQFPPDAIAIGTDERDVDRLVLMRGSESGALGNEVYWWTRRNGKLKKVADDIGDLD
jgi:hypothetical protein